MNRVDLDKLQAVAQGEGFSEAILRSALELASADSESVTAQINAIKRFIKGSNDNDDRMRLQDFVVDQLRKVPAGGFPPVDKTLEGCFETHAGKSVAVLIQRKGYALPEVGYYFAELGVWSSASSGCSDIEVVEWWPLPTSGTKVF